ncbi:MAG TPA: hypothetical protein VG410_10425 [Solirubrobacteraceae bacterium]|jgi:hypothetical protein|nr:hypothetical protein [Solirubrobacteraceae bacterium]
MSTTFEPLLLPLLVPPLLELLLEPHAASAAAELTTAHPVINLPRDLIFLLCSPGLSAKWPVANPVLLRALNPVAAI